MMSRTILKSTVLTIAACAAMLGADPKTVDGVKAAERGWGAATASADEAALNKILADDLTYTHSSGENDTKAIFIDNMKSGARKYHEVTYKSVDARLYGNAAVVMVVGAVKTSVKGAMQAPANLRMLHLWVYQNGAWRLAAHQSLRLPN